MTPDFVVGVFCGIMYSGGGIMFATAAYAGFTEDYAPRQDTTRAWMLSVLVGVLWPLAFVVALVALLVWNLRKAFVR